ncbi:pentatricopeptide repeat-containing protein [Acrasis kona]|uniref:Pentatricopeptide repeat-containing protein n=1 Tax=Acrasis kona TaxID=1008807 RepID=A0AAW2YKT6_9EUKA
MVKVVFRSIPWVIPNYANRCFSKSFTTRKTVETAKQIRSLVDEGKIKEAVEFYESQGKKSDYRTLYESLHKLQSDDSKEVLKQLNNADNTEDSDIFNTNIFFSDSVEQAKEIYDKIEEDKKDPNTYDALIAVYLKCENNEDAYKTLEQAIKSEVKVKQKTIKRIIDAFVEDNDIKEAEKVLRLCASYCIEPGTTIYNVVLGGIIKTGDHESAKRLFELMGPDKNKDTFLIMLKNHLQREDQKSVDALLKEFLTETDVKDPLSSVIETYVEQSKHESVKALLETVEEKYGIKVQEKHKNLVQIQNT